MNKWIGHGRLVRDPELRYTNNGKPVCNMTIAVEDGYGKYKNTEYLKVISWGKKGKAVAEYLEKGRAVIVEGKLRIRKNEKDGKTYVNPEIIADSVKFLSNSSSENAEEVEEDSVEDTDTVEDDVPLDDEEEPLF